MTAVLSKIGKHWSTGSINLMVLNGYDLGTFQNRITKNRNYTEYTNKKDTNRQILIQERYGKWIQRGTEQKDSQTLSVPITTWKILVPVRCKQCANTPINKTNWKEQHCLMILNQGLVFVGHVLSCLEQGKIRESGFRYFLNDLESTPLGQYAPQICDRLFQIVKRNIRLSEDRVDERIALGCAIRKLVFNLTDENLSLVAQLLSVAKKSRNEDNATPVEMLLYKALVDRFEFRPLARNARMRSIANMCYKTIIQFGNTIDTRTETTQVVFADALLGFACYATEDRLAKNPLYFELPGHLCRILAFMGQNIQDAIRQKRPEEHLQLDILSFIRRLTKKHK